MTQAMKLQMRHIQCLHKLHIIAPVCSRFRRFSIIGQNKKTIVHYFFFNATRYRQIFRHSSSQFLYAFAYLFAYFKMCLVGILLTFYVFPSQLFFRLCSTKQISCQFGTSHVVKYLLAFGKSFSFVYAFGVKPAI